jgi:hypothetical protein
VLGFLAGLLGLGNIPAKIKGIFAKVQEPIGKVVDAIVGTVAKVGKKLLGKLKRKKTDEDTPEDKERRLQQGLAAAVKAVNTLSGIKLLGPKLIKPVLAAIKFRYKMTELTPIIQNGKWAVKGVINPEGVQPTTRTAPDRAKVLAAVTAAEGERAKAQAAWQAAGGQSDTVYASGGGPPRQQGGGTKKEATETPDAAFRYEGAERSRNEVLGAAQKLAYMNDPLVSPADLTRMQYDAAFLREIKQRMEARGIFGIPRGSHKDQPKHQPITAGPADPNAGQRRIGSEAAVHAEILVYQLDGSPSAIGVWGIPQCGSCQSLFKSFAQAKGSDGFIIVAGMDMVRIFLSDGQIRSPEQFEADFPAA